MREVECGWVRGVECGWVRGVECGWVRGVECGWVRGVECGWVRAEAAAALVLDAHASSKNPASCEQELPLVWGFVGYFQVHLLLNRRKGEALCAVRGCMRGVVHSGSTCEEHPQLQLQM